MVRAQRVLLSSATRTATLTVGPVNELQADGARFYLNASAASGTGGLTFSLQGYDKESGNSITLAADTSAITATGLYVFEFWPSGVLAATGNRRIADSLLLPVQWGATITHGDGSNYTYSLSVETGF